MYKIIRQFPGLKFVMKGATEITHAGTMVHAVLFGLVMLLCVHLINSTLIKDHLKFLNVVENFKTAPVKLPDGRNMACIRESRDQFPLAPSHNPKYQQFKARAATGEVEEIRNTATGESDFCIDCNDKCLPAFRANGGCKAMLRGQKKEAGKFIPGGCESCGADIFGNSIMEYCNRAAADAAADAATAADGAAAAAAAAAADEWEERSGRGDWDDGPVRYYWYNTRTHEERDDPPPGLYERDLHSGVLTEGEVAWQAARKAKEDAAAARKVKADVAHFSLRAGAVG